MNKQQLKKNTDRLDATLDRIMEMEIGVSDNSDDYTLAYIAGKLALVMACSERLSSYSTLLSKHSLKVIRGAQSAKALVKIKTFQFMNTPEYKSKPRGRQKVWLELQLAPYEESALHWGILDKSLSIVHDALTEKITMFRRTDSNLRLQTKIIEIPNNVGHGVPSSQMQGEGLPCRDI